MKTVILPGYSLKNKEWADDIKREIKLDHAAIVHEWQHWSKGSFSLPLEVKLILDKVGKEKINIIAKSVGTRVAMKLVAKIPTQANKVILCGIPTKGESENAKKAYSSGLSILSPTQVVVFQNTSDPFASYEIIKKFIGSINLRVKVIEKPRSDHHYPYPKDFQEFLKN